MTFAASRRWERVTRLLAVLILISVLLWFFQDKPPTPGGGRPQGPVSVSASKARLGDFDVHLNALGTVTAFNTTTIRARVSGELIRIHFKEGQTVKPGELLADIDPRLLQNQLDQSMGKLQGDRAQLDFAEAELQRDRQLIEKGYIALSQLQTQHAEVNRLKGLIASDLAEIESLKLQLSFTRITAPLGGRIGLKLVDLGNILNVLDPIAIITQMQPISILFNVPQDLHILMEQRIHEDPDLPVEAFDRNSTVKIAEGRLTSADNLIDPSSGTLRVKAVFQNDDLSLYPNQFVNIRLVLETLHDKTLIPRHAVMEGADGSQVFQVLENATVHIQKVRTGPAEGEVIVIEEGLAPGDVVVTEGLDKLREGTPVQWVDSTAGKSSIEARPQGHP